MSIWEANKNGTDEQFKDLAYAMVNIRSQLETIKSNLSLNTLVGTSRSLSVEIRKLLLDGGLQWCINRPMLNKLIRPDRLTGDVYEQVFDIQGGEFSITKIDEPMAGQVTVVPISPARYEIAVYPLYGLRFEKSRSQWISESPFDGKLTPLRLDRWLKQPVLRVDKDQYDMRQMLSEVANTQGAHSDHQNDAIRQRISEHCRSEYMNIFVLMVGIYLQNQFANSLATDSSLKSRLATVYPKIEEDAQYGVTAHLTFNGDIFGPIQEWRSLSLGYREEPILSKTIIRVPPN